MRKIKYIGCVVGVLAFSALTVAIASATLWLRNGASIVSETAVDSHGTVIGHHTGGISGSFTVECTGLAHGTVGPGALGLLTEVLGLLSTEKNLVKCRFTQVGGCGNVVGEEIEVHAINLPWHGLLELIAGKTIGHALSEAGKEPGVEYPCPKIFGFKGSCKGLDTASFVSNGTNGAIFEDSGANKVACSDGGEGTTLGLGELLGVQVS